ncbi:MAG: hypothetical protein ACLPQS_17435 [Acidimicrobiales bacterium]
MQAHALPAISGLEGETVSLASSATLSKTTDVYLTCGSTGSTGQVNADYTVITAARAGQLVKGSLHLG